ncbi:MAG: DUF202 domain-containing protein [Acidimicrobiales bacterium]
MSDPHDADEAEGPYAVELQHERTALAWERTAFSILAVGVVLARFPRSRTRACWSPPASRCWSAGPR